MQFRISNIYKSLVRHTTDTVELIVASGLSPELEYYAWDSRGEDAELDSKDLLGLAGWTFQENKGLWQLHAGLTLSTINDENLIREAEIMDLIHDMWGEECIVPMRDDQGNEYTQLVIKEFEVLAAGQSEKRNFRPIGLTLLRTANA